MFSNYFGSIISNNFVSQIVWIQMLNHLGIEAFVGGNLGNPLSEAAFHCIALPSSKPKFQASSIFWLMITFHSTYLFPLSFQQISKLMSKCFSGCSSGS